MGDGRRGGGREFAPRAPSLRRLDRRCVHACSTHAGQPHHPHPPPRQRPTRWVDSVLATLSPRDKAAQLVWPQLFGDYTPTSSAGWTRIESLITRQHVGGFIMSIGSPIETAVKLNAMQRLSTLPLVIGADYETGAGMRQRGGYFLPNNIDLGGATMFPPQMGLGASRDTSLAYQQGRITALEGRALGVHIAFAPVLDVNNNPAQSRHRRAVVRRGSAPRRRHGRGVDPRHSGARHDRHGKALSRARRHRRELAPHRHDGPREPRAHRQRRARAVSRARSQRAFRE